MDKNIVLVFGNFNIVHPGHLRLLRFAKSLNAELHVAVASDNIAGKAGHVPEKLRLDSILSNSYVDKAFLYNKPITEVIRELKPKIVVKGKEYENQHNEELEVLKEYGGKLVFGSGEVSFSSIDLLRKEMLDSKNLSIINPAKFNKRHSIKERRPSELVKLFSTKNICVIGDMIIDEYITCEPLGMSQEDPTIVVKPITSLKFVGGAGIVASHGSSMGANTHFISVLGNDDRSAFVMKELKSNKVKTHIFNDDSRPSSLKQRFRSKGKTLLRVSDLSENSISKDIQMKIFSKLKKIINDIDLIIFSDFNYGVLPQPLVEKITKLAKDHGVTLAADSQSSSQTGDIARFKNADIITPTEREARISLRDNQSGLVGLAENLRKETSAEHIFLKLGEEGLLIHSGNPEIPENWVTDRVNVLNESPRDVAGAGDSMLIASSLALICGANIWESAFLGSIAAAIQISRVGNTPIQQKEILNVLKSI